MSRRVAWAAALAAVAMLVAIDQAATFGHLKLLTAKPDPLASRAGGLVVFFAGEDPERGLNLETQRRLAHVEARLRGGFSGPVLCVGGARERDVRSGAEQMRDALLARGLPPARVLVGGGSHDTWTNLARAFEAARSRGWPSLVMVSSPAHAARIRRLSASHPGRSGLPVYLDPYPYERASPPAGWLTIWRQVHYEWAVAALQLLLPDATYVRFVRWWRNGRRERE